MPADYCHDLWARRPQWWELRLYHANQAFWGVGKIGAGKRTLLGSAFQKEHCYINLWIGQLVPIPCYWIHSTPRRFGFPSCDSKVWKYLNKPQRGGLEMLPSGGSISVSLKQKKMGPTGLWENQTSSWVNLNSKDLLLQADAFKATHSISPVQWFSSKPHLCSVHPTAASMLSAHDRQ